MSRSRKKVAMMWLTKKWNNIKERSFRRRIKQALHDIETDFDPDRDWEEVNLSHKKAGGEIGTKMGYEVKPNENELDPYGEPYIDDYEEYLRK